jgi:hypothetical protein
MNTVRTVSAQFAEGSAIASFYIDIPFEVDMVRLVNMRSYAANIYPTTPRISFLPKNQIVSLGNKSAGFPSALPVEFYYDRPTPIIGTYTITNDVVIDTTAHPVAYVICVFEFWSGYPIPRRPTDFQNELLVVDTKENSFALDILFPVHEIVIENVSILNFNTITTSSLIFYSDFLPTGPSIVRDRDPLVGTTLVSNGLSKTRVSSGVLGIVSNTYDNNSKVRYRFKDPIFIRGNYRIWFEADPQPYPANQVLPTASGIWEDGTDTASFFIKFLSY